MIRAGINRVSGDGRPRAVLRLRREPRPHDRADRLALHRRIGRDGVPVGRRRCSAARRCTAPRRSGRSPAIGGFASMGVVRAHRARCVVNFFLGSGPIGFDHLGRRRPAVHRAHGVGRPADPDGRTRRDAGSVEKAAVIGALRLYLDFVNLFLFLLRLTGRPPLTVARIAARERFAAEPVSRPRRRQPGSARKRSHEAAVESGRPGGPTCSPGPCRSRGRAGGEPARRSRCPRRRPDAEAVGQRHDGPDDADVRVRTSRSVTNERSILIVSSGRLAQVGERRVARPEVVEDDPDAERRGAAGGRRGSPRSGP